MKKMVVGGLIGVAIIIGAYVGIDVGPIIDALTNTTQQDNVNTFIQDAGKVQVYFCPHQNCSNALVDFVDTAEKSIHCALYELDLPDVQSKILEKQANPDIDVKIVTDSDYLYEFNHSFVKIDSWGLMHNKFCIVDGKKVSTGSMNPTVNDATKNNNNFLLFDSIALSSNYEDEFKEMWNGTFKKGENVRSPSVRINQTEVRSYFCPEDKCADKVKEELAKAKASIYFMTFSFTHKEIANIILLKHQENLTIQGVMEARQVTKDSVFQQLQYQGIDVMKDKNKANMHHKVFIIDNQTVVTGSFNPTNGGDSRNDENLLIINDERIANAFVEEFGRVYREAKT